MSNYIATEWEPCPREAIEELTWYHIRDGELVSGAAGNEDGLYRAKDIYRVLASARINDEDAYDFIYWLVDELLDDWQDNPLGEVICRRLHRIGALAVEE